MSEQAYSNLSPQDRIIDMACDALYGIRPVLHTQEFDKLVSLLCSYNSYVTGVGKAALAAQKLACTLASNGVKSMFIHATELLHGDFGCVSIDDVLIAFSNSGKTNEIAELLQKAIESNITFILITGNGDTEIAKKANLTLNYGKIQEACVLNLTPTISSIVQFAISDALAMCVQNKLGLTYNEYSRNHGGGYLGYISKLKSEIEHDRR